ncbi:hypothetical protein DDZ14_01300 [Maritimibacter sp. 55A14]|nr:hypothetical protein DDZ14_01300 [Maritimibacter sp. 55A14]
MGARNAPTTRRRVLLGAGAAIFAVALGVHGWRSRRPFEGPELSAPEAFEKARAGEIFLIDIRRPDEWARTGVPQGGHPLDMRRDDFEQALARITAADPDRPVALICARGVRSSQLTARLQAAGMTRLIDIPEGMNGSAAGPGWVRRGLPVVVPDAAQG